MVINLRGRCVALGVALILALAAWGCKPQAAQGNTGRPVVVATTTMIGDMAAQLGQGVVTVETIMRPGGDPHLYQPTPKNAKAVAGSQLVLTNGLHLEGWIDDLVKNAGGQRPVVVVSQGVQAISMDGFAGGVDPHFWFDVMAWKVATQNTQDALIKLVASDAAKVQQIKDNTLMYNAKLDRLHAWASERLGTIPKGQRVLITSHDAFNYFGRAFDLEVVGIQGLSTEQEASQRDVANIIELVRARSVPAIFIETSVNPALIEQVAREAKIKVAGPLYSDSLGPSGGAAASYVGMFAENVRLITEALGGRYEPFVDTAEAKGSAEQVR